MAEIEWTKIDQPLVEQAAAVMELAKRRKRSLVTAESCTGGLVAAVLSEAPGASEWLHGGFATYTKEHKTAALGVSANLIATAGAVSEPVARAMAEGALTHSRADVAVSVTGVAGPTLDDDGTPVGIVHFAVAQRGSETMHICREYGDIGRGPCRYASIKQALTLFTKALSGQS